VVAEKYPSVNFYVKSVFIITRIKRNWCKQIALTTVETLCQKKKQQQQA